MIGYEEFIGLPLGKAVEAAGDAEYEIVDFSEPNKFHKDTKASLRVVKVEHRADILRFYVAGFADEIKE